MNELVKKFNREAEAATKYSRRKLRRHVYITAHVKYREYSKVVVVFSRVYAISMAN